MEVEKMKPIVLLNNVTKTFKNKKAVDHVSFEIQKGEAVAILGPNGAGKTTAIMMMLGLLEPSSGDVRLFNQHPKERKVRDKIGAMLQEVSVIDALNVREIIQLFRSYYSDPLPFKELTVLTGLTEADLKKRAEKLSGGQKRRLSFALAMAGNPDLLFFDEPTVGMDITSRKLFWNTIKLLKEKGKTIVFTTHYMQEAEDGADRIILFNDGKIIEDGTPIELKTKLSKQSVSFVANENISTEKLLDLPAVSAVTRNDERIFLITDDTDLVLAALYEKKLDISGIQIEQGRLDEVFEQLTKKREAI